MSDELKAPFKAQAQFENDQYKDKMARWNSGKCIGGTGVKWSLGGTTCNDNDDDVLVESETLSNALYAHGNPMCGALLQCSHTGQTRTETWRRARRRTRKTRTCM
jgi:hypothetical protein